MTNFAIELHGSYILNTLTTQHKFVSRRELFAYLCSFVISSELHHALQYRSVKVHLAEEREENQL